MWRVLNIAAAFLLVAAAPVLHDDPLELEIVRTDVERFWQAFDRLERNPETDPFAEYIEGGSPGLRDFVPDERIKSSEALRELVLAERAYYRAIRADSLATDHYDARVRAGLLALKQLYPKARFPTLYYVIGRTTSGGTAGPSGMIVGLETLARNPVKTAYGRPSLPMELLPEIVVHEMIHFLQSPQRDDATLLDAAMREGVADFVAELATGSAVLELNGREVHAYGRAHERQLWKEFEAAMRGTSTDGWLYGSPLRDRPQNLGYFIGYRIAQAYYDRSTDKRAAVAKLIEMPAGAERILRESGYAGGAEPSPASPEAAR